MLHFLFSHNDQIKKFLRLLLKHKESYYTKILRLWKKDGKANTLKEMMQRNLDEMMKW